MSASLAAWHYNDGIFSMTFMRLIRISIISCSLPAWLIALPLATPQAPLFTKGLFY
ncbi:Uncharacterised protein [Yersinia frederiksenii]|nr:Uncharacterised protein [Yersinia frederiksenii]CNK94182.1 Uncharacterised protein [Yersinia frederiksenii]